MVCPAPYYVLALNSLLLPLCNMIASLEALAIMRRGPLYLCVDFLRFFRAAEKAICASVSVFRFLCT